MVLTGLEDPFIPSPYTIENDSNFVEKFLSRYLSPARGADDAPLLLRVFREDGREKYMVFCTSVAPTQIHCRFEGLRVNVFGDHTSTKQGKRRTCSLFAQQWTTDFHRVSQNKWVNSPAPSGLCNITKLYQLERASDRVLWDLIETPISGDTDSPHCEGVDKELMSSLGGSGTVRRSTSYHVNILIGTSGETETRAIHAIVNIGCCCALCFYPETSARLLNSALIFRISFVALFAGRGLSKA